ncbi:hypothetical protein Nepgr_026736 [Nepenthes gracilis]|uniref:Uncharacterized protein n=1 Tax=Nepenthes gracilis TaxID=150966 RepID=A0AAD3T8T6_NEPGR|nr:hypothetical protein Nepgr_026736 [Nepenthes gracilis]
MLRACFGDGRNLGYSSCLAEFAYNNGYQASIGMAPFEALCGRKCQKRKSYADKRRKELSFEIGDLVFLKVSPMKGTFRFGVKES